MNRVLSNKKAVFNFPVSGAVFVFYNHCSADFYVSILQLYRVGWNRKKRYLQDWITTRNYFTITAMDSGDQLKIH